MCIFSPLGKISFFLFITFIPSSIFPQVVPNSYDFISSQSHNSSACQPKNQQKHHKIVQILIRAVFKNSPIVFHGKENNSMQVLNNMVSFG